MARFRNVFCLLVVVTVVGAASADSITTLFARNNGGSLGGAVYFDVTVGALPIDVTGYDTNTAETVPFGWEVFVTAPGISSQGQEQNPGAWTSVATGTGVGAGVNLPSPVTLNNTFLLDANTLYGMALVMGSNAGHDYTNGTGANQNYSNPAVALALGSASNIPFSSSPFSPRVWNGTIYYDVIPEPSTLALLAMGGLALIRRR